MSMTAEADKTILKCPRIGERFWLKSTSELFTVHHVDVQYYENGLPNITMTVWYEEENELMEIHLATFVAKQEMGDIYPYSEPKKGKIVGFSSS